MRACSDEGTIISAIKRAQKFANQDNSPYVITKTLKVAPLETTKIINDSVIEVCSPVHIGKEGLTPIEYPYDASRHEKKVKIFSSKNN